MNRRAFLASLPAWSRLSWRNGATLPYQDSESSVSVLRYPYLQNVQSDRATIMWSTFEPGFGELQFSADGVNYQYAAARQRLFEPAETNLHYRFAQYQVDLSGLSPNTSYLYRAIVDGEPVINDGRFRTAGPGPFTFLVLGDSGQGSAAQFRLAWRMSSESPSMVLHTGDVAYFSGTFAQFQANHFDYYQVLMGSAPMFTTPGNHDCFNNGVSAEVDDTRAYLSLHAFPAANVPPQDYGRYYSFDWSNAHFVSIDSSVSLGKSMNSFGPMLRWLEQDLLSTRKFWRVALVHHPPYASGPNERDLRAFWVRRHVVPILEAHGVQVVFSGDEHNYQRSRTIRGEQIVPDGQGTAYFTSGGGGAELYDFDPANPLVAAGRKEHHYLRVEVNGAQMMVRAINAEGAEIDSHLISPQPVLARDPVTFYPSGAGGTLVRISGYSLAFEEAVAADWPPPIQLAGASLAVNGQALPLYYASHEQIYAELPAGMSGPMVFTVVNPNGAAEAAAVVP